MAKRPRLVQSPSTREVGLAPPPPLSSDVNWPRRSPGPKSSGKARSSIFIISPPADVDPHQNFDFLEKCHFCNRRISPDHVFMYRDLGGFCTAECREWQMFIDGAVNQVAAKRAKKRTRAP